MIAHSDRAGLHWQVPVARWASWNVDADKTQSPDVSFVTPMARRRLSHLAKMTLRAAHDCAHTLKNVRFVFSSRHGDLVRTTTMLEDLADSKPLSPTAFSQSVLNASAGLFSILRSDTSESTAISSSESSFGFGLLEAAMQFAEKPNSPVLFVYADEPAPAFYGSESASTGPAHALAVLLACDSTLKFEFSMTQSDKNDSHQPHSVAFLASLADGASGSWHGEGRCWNWKTQ